MNETVFREILGESLRREFAEFDSVPEHRFSLGHRLAMKRIFARYEKNIRRMTTETSVETMPYYSFKQRIIIALVIVILMTLLTGWFIPIRGITEAQIDWLRSRYDFPNMKIHITESFTPYNDSEYAVLGLYKVNDEYLNFLSDLEKLEIYTAEEVSSIYAKIEPFDTRPDSFSNEYLIETITTDLGNDTPLDSTREFVSRLENKMEYYIERSKDADRAVEGDAEFAALIKDKYLSLQMGFLELLEKLFDDSSNDDSSENQSNVLLVLDKDDKRYLFDINKSYKC